MAFSGNSVSKESSCNAGDLGLIPGLGRSPGEGNGKPLQYSSGEFHGQRSLVDSMGSIGSQRVRHNLATKQLYSPWDSPVQSTGVGSLSLLQGIVPTQGSNPGLPLCRWILYQLSHKGSTKQLCRKELCGSRETS